MLAPVLLEAFLFLTIDLAIRGDGTFVAAEHDEIRRLAKRISPKGEEALEAAQQWYDGLEPKDVPANVERSIRVLKAVHDDHPATLSYLLASLAEVVKADDWISDNEAALIARIREAWNLPVVV